MDGFNISNEAFKGTITSNEVHSDNNTKQVSLSKSGKSSLISRANTEDSRVLYQISCLLDKKKQKNNKVMEHSTMNEEIEILSCDSEHSEFISFDSSITTRFPKDSMDIKGGDFTLSGPEEGHYMNDSFPLAHRAPRAPPLNKSEERALKRIRRKIKNKLSAQESRRKKKEYVENLEKQVATCTSENSVLNEQVISLNHTVRTLLKEIQRMQESKPKQNKGTQTGICLKCHLLKSAERRRVPESTNNLVNIEISWPQQ